MPKREKGPNYSWLKFISVFLFIFSLLGLLGGAFGFIIGKQIYSMFSSIMGSMAWVGLFLCLVLSFFLWTRSISAGSFRSPGNRRERQYGHQSPDQSKKSIFEHDNVSKGISLPAGQLVSLQGFNQYFSSPEWVEMKDEDTQMAEEMEEIGRDFPSYFGIGNSHFPNKPRKMTILKGLEDYIEEVDHEEKVEHQSPSQDRITLKEVPRIQPEKTNSFSSAFKSQAEQEAFLAQFRIDEKPLDQETLDYVGDLREGSRTIDEAEKIAQVVECSISKIELDTKIISILDANSREELTNEPTNELMSEPTLVADMKDETLERVCAAMEIKEYIVPVAAALEFKPNSTVQVAPLVEELQDQLETAEKPQVVNTVERVNLWKFPDFELLDLVPQRVIIQDTETSKLLEKVLLDFGVKAKVIRVTSGPVITRYELAPAPGVKISKIVNLSDDIALGLAARDVRIEAPIPGKAAIGIEVPNKQARSVPFREVLETTSFGEYPSKLKVALGKDIADQPIIADLIKMPHLLVAGATGSGKSVCITTIINSILYNATPDEVKFLLVDPKMVELSQYNGIPHLLAPVVVDPKKAASALKWIVKEMENRYELFAASGVRDIERYNKLKAVETIRATPALPFIVVIIDELADLMMVAAGEVEEAICRLAQMARAAGIHLVIATQRPSVDVITGVIKANIPSRISFAVSSQIDSRTILDATGAEKLLGRGDMLYSPLGVNKALRVQGCLVTDDEVHRVILHWKGLGRPEYLDPERLFAETNLKNEESNGPDDALFIDAGQLFIKTNIASVSYLQRRLKLGYARAARLMDMLEEQGVVGAYEASKPRQVLLTLEEFNERFG
ncbi:MAG TPA: DNA translocase FtsK [Desulfosporosinus sp.]|nr:DNA translocase FtsK [Desulfosporosinus sp.]